MFLKPDVQLSGIDPEITLALGCLDMLWLERGMRGVTVTSALDGQHCRKSEGRPCPDGRAESLHYVGRAVDIRTKDLPADFRKIARQAIKEKLGGAYDVVDEGSHFHVEYDPK